MKEKEGKEIMILDEKLFEYKIAAPKKKYAYDEFHNKGFNIYADFDQKADYYIKPRNNEERELAKKILKKHKLKFFEEKYRGNYLIYFNENIDLPKTSYKKTRHFENLNKEGRLENLKVKGHRGTWYEVDKMEVNGKTYYLLESEIWGDEANLLVITADQSEVYQTFDDIETTLIDLDILNEALKEEFKPFFFDEYFEDAAIATADDLDVTQYLDKGYNTFKELIDNELTKEILDGPGSVNERDETYKWFTLRYPHKTKVGLKLYGEPLKENIDYRLAAPNRAKMEDLLENGIIEPKAIVNMVAHYMSTDEEQEFLNYYDYNEETLDEIEIKSGQLANNLLDWLSDDDVAELMRLNSIEEEEEEILEENLESIVYTDEEHAAVGLLSVLNDLIKDEWGAVDFYNSAIVTAQSEGFTEIADVLYDILEEENVHIGQLQKCMEMLSTTTDKIKEGEKEAEEQLNDSEVEPEHIEQPQEDETV